ncbi:MAG: site-specific DNA-methyltransferase [Lysinibacillus sp.]|nr:site-specific DNA-methyltransferase [Lysinibacillus sp.]
MFGGLKVFDYPKPVSLIKYLMDFVCEKDDIILDFFSGSATTAHAVLEKNKEDGGNRKFILVQYPEPIDKDSAVYQAGYHTICDIGEQRIRLALEELGLDVGFKVFKLDDSNIKEWSIEFEDIENDLDFFSNAFKKESSELDIVYEIMLKQGLELTYPINSFEVDGKRIYDIAFGNLFICLADKIDTNVAKAIIAKRDEYEIETSSVIFSDAGFDGNDSEKLNCIELLKDAGYPEDNLLTI